jgi:predicted O-linked N-acetylglucosamine transferase (SPINDLY family)
MSIMNPQLHTMLQQAIQAFQGGNFESANLILKRVLLVDKKNLPALHILGLIKASQGSFREAVDYLSRAVRIQPNDASIHYNLAKALSDSGKDKDAITHHKKAVALDPDNPGAWLSYGKSASNLGRYEDALVWYGNALSLKPDYVEALLNKGATLKELKRNEEAIALAEQALAINPNLTEAWSNKGVALKELKRFDEAIAHYDKALSLKPDYAEGWSNKGNTLNELKRFDEAIAHYDKALSLKPDIDWISGDLLHIKMKVCSWSGAAGALENISKKVVANEKVISPFSLLALNDDALLHKKSSEIYVQSRYPFNPVLGPVLKRLESQKIRVGYFSADFRNHPVSFLTTELYELHDKNKFEIIAFSFGVDDRSPMRSRLQQAFSQFIDVSDMSDLEIVELSRNLQIDIAVDLGGYTTNSRTKIFSYRAAPIQLSYIGYLGTMGAEYYDYLLADKTIIPDELQRFYSEKIAYLPSYQANDRKRIISDRQFTKEELGLPEAGFVFCCFNNNYKILPFMFDAWMRILNAVDGSVLFLYADNERSKANLIHEADLRGIDSARIVFGGRIHSEEYLARYRVCDLFLDTFPYNAGTTASDALWVGLPVVTLMGQSFASRMASSLLNAIGLPELVTTNQEDYEVLAIELAKNPKKLADIKLKLAANRLTAPLFDTPLFTKNIETAYIKMMQRYFADLKPDHISIV